MISNKTRKFLAAFISIACIKCAADVQKNITYGDEKTDSNISETVINPTADDSVAKYVYGTVAETEVSNNEDTQSLETSSTANSADTDNEVTDTTESSASSEDTAAATTESTTPSDPYALEKVTIKKVDDTIDEADLQNAITKYSALLGQQLDEYNVKFILRDVDSYKKSNKIDSLDTETEKAIADGSLQTLAYYFNAINSGNALLDYYYSIGCSKGSPNSIHENNLNNINYSIAYTLDLSENSCPTKADFDKVCAAIQARIDDDKGHSKLSISEYFIGVDIDSLPGFEDVCRSVPTSYDVSIIKINLGIATVNDFTFVGFNDEKGFINEYNLPFIEKAAVKAQKEKLIKYNNGEASSPRLTKADIGNVITLVTNSLVDSFNECNSQAGGSSKSFETIGAEWIKCLNLKLVNDATYGNTHSDRSNIQSLKTIEAYALSAMLSSSEPLTVDGNVITLETLKSLDQSYFNAIGKKIQEIKDKDENKNKQFISNEEARQAISDGIKEINTIYNKFNNKTADSSDYKALNINIGKCADVSDINNYLENSIPAAGFIKTAENIQDIQKLVDQIMDTISRINENIVNIDYEHPTSEGNNEYKNAYTYAGLTNIDRYNIDILKDVVTKARADKRQKILKERKDSNKVLTSAEELMINNYLSLSEVKELYTKELAKINASYLNIKNGTAKLQDYINAKVDFMPALNLMQINAGLKNHNNISDTTLSSNNLVNGFTTNVRHKEDYDDLQAEILSLALKPSEGNKQMFNEYTEKIIKREISNVRKGINHVINTSNASDDDDDNKDGDLGSIISTTISNLNKCFSSIYGSADDNGNFESKGTSDHYTYAQLPWVFWANVKDADDILKGNSTLKPCVDHDVKTMDDYYTIVNLYRTPICCLSYVNNESNNPADFKGIAISDSTNLNNLTDYTAEIVRDSIIEKKKTDPIFKEQQTYHISDIEDIASDTLDQLLDSYKRMNANEEGYNADYSDFNFAQLGYTFTLEETRFALADHVIVDTADGPIKITKDINKDVLKYLDNTFKEKMNHTILSVNGAVGSINTSDALYSHYDLVGLNTEPYILDLTKAEIAENFKNTNTHASGQKLKDDQAKLIASLNTAYSNILSNNASISDYNTLKLKHLSVINSNNLEALTSSICSDIKTPDTASDININKIAELQYSIDKYIKNPENDLSLNLSNEEKEMIDYELTAIDPRCFHDLNEYNIQIINKYANINAADKISDAENIIKNLDDTYKKINIGQAQKADYEKITSDPDLLTKIGKLDDAHLLILNNDISGKLISKATKATVTYDTYATDIIDSQVIIRTADDYKIVTDALEKIIG